MNNEKKLKYLAYFGGLTINPWQDMTNKIFEEQNDQISGIQEICEKHNISCDELVILSDNAMFQNIKDALSARMGCAAFIIGDDLAKKSSDEIAEMVKSYADKYIFIVVVFPHQKAMKDKVPCIRGILTKIPKLHEYIIDWRGNIIGRERKNS